MKGIGWLAALVALAACSGSGVHAGAGASTTTVPSQATVMIGDTSFAFTVTCYDAGVDSVVAIGTGVEPGGSRPTHLLVQAFVTQSYVGITVGDREVVYESSLDQPLQLEFDDHAITGSDITFVRNLDIAHDTGDPAGTGSVRVDCASFAPGIPPTTR